MGDLLIQVHIIIKKAVCFEPFFCQLEMKNQNNVSIDLGIFILIILVFCLYWHPPSNKLKLSVSGFCLHLFCFLLTGSVSSNSVPKASKYIEGSMVNFRWKSLIQCEFQKIMSITKLQRENASEDYIKHKKQTCHVISVGERHNLKTALRCIVLQTWIY